MRNIERFIEEQALELACKLDEVDVVKWHEWARTAYHRQDQHRVFKEYYGDQPGDEAVYRTVKRAVQATGIIVKVCPQARGVLGSQDPDTRTIELAPRVQTGLRIGLLIHEWTHAILHSHINSLVWEFYYKERGELEAESTAYIVCKALGITLNSSAHYIRATNNQTSSDLLGTSLQDIKRAATQILEALMVADLC